MSIKLIEYSLNPFTCRQYRNYDSFHSSDKIQLVESPRLDCAKRAITYYYDMAGHMNNLQYQVVSYPEWNVVLVALQVWSITVYATNFLGKHTFFNATLRFRKERGIYLSTVQWSLNLVIWHWTTCHIIATSRLNVTVEKLRQILIWLLEHVPPIPQL